MSSSRAIFEYHLVLPQHPEAMMDVRVSTALRAERSPERGGMRGQGGCGMLRRGLEECAGYLSALKSGSSGGVCHPGRMKNG